MKKLARDALTFGIAGVGLGMLGGVSSDSPSASSALGTLGTGLGVAGGMMMVGHGLRIMNENMPKKWRY